MDRKKEKQPDQTKKEAVRLQRRVKKLEAGEKEKKIFKKPFTETEELYQAFAEISPDAIVISDLNMNIVMVNRRAVELHGCKNKDELIGKNSFEFIAPHDRERAKENARKTFEHGNVRNIEYTLLKKDGTPFFAEISASVIKDSDGKPVVLIGVVRDISARKRFQNELNESKELYQKLIETSPDSITLTDINGKIVMANQVAFEMRGYDKKEEFIGKNHFDLISPQDLEKARENIKELLKKGRLKNREYSLFKKDGTIFSADVSVSLIKDAEGNIRCYMAVVRDISKRKKIEQALSAEKERLSVTLRSIAEAVITADTNGSIVLVNRAGEQLTGWKQNDAIGLPLDKVLHINNNGKPIKCNEMVRDVVKTGEVLNIYSNRRLIAKNGMERVINLSCSPIRDSKDSIVGVVLIIRDISYRKKLEKELFKTKKLESIGTLAGGIAHDFNNILTGITSNLFLAKINLNIDSDTYKSIIEAEKAAFRASKLTSQLLTFAKGSSPIKENVSINELIEETVGFSLSGSNIDCKLDLPNDLWHVEIDRGQIDQVINNLIINAEQAMPEGGIITIKGENINISDKIPKGTSTSIDLKPGKYIKISIMDEGIGIHPDHLEKIFDPYFTTKQKGSGLGLSICYSILQKHNGSVFVKSRLGKGTTFQIYIPALLKKVHKEIVEEKKFLVGSGKILVMDDEKMVRFSSGLVLKCLGYNVEFANDGSEAIEMYKKAMESGEPFDALIMDLTVPGGMGGKEAITKLFEIDPNVKAIVSSGYSNDPVMANFKKYGFKGVVTKPYRIEELNKVINKVINGQ